MKALFYICIVIAMALFFCYSCNNKVDEVLATSTVNPPFKSLQPQYMIVKLTVDSVYKYQHHTGTEIVFTQNSLTDTAGNPVKGNIELYYREYHNASDIFLSGIPMTYQANNDEKPFVSAGMFDIKAKQGDMDLKINPQEGVLIKMASYHNGADYPLFELDSVSGKWRFVDNVEPIVNNEKIEITNEINRLRAKTKFPLNKKYFAMNYMSLLDVYYANNCQKIHANKDDFSLQTHFVKYGLEWANAYSYQHVKYKGVTYMSSMLVWKMLNCSCLPNWAVTNQSKFLVKKLYGNTYAVTFTHISDTCKIFTAKARIEMPLSALMSFTPEYWERNYEEAMATVRSEEKRKESMAEVFRVMKINNFGIFNYDKVLNNEFVVVNADFEIENDSLASNRLDLVYFIPENNQSVTSFYKPNWGDLRIYKDLRGVFLTIYDDNKVAVFDAKDFDIIDYEQIKSEKSPRFKFVLHKTNIEIKTKKDIEQLITQGIEV